MAQLPIPPFYFRIYSPNGQGIVYRADKDNGHSFMCTGSRQIGKAGSFIVWEVGGYADAMPKEAMHTIMGAPVPFSSEETNAFIKKQRLDPKYKQMSLYSDVNGYWFDTKVTGSRGRSASRGRSRGRSASKGRSKSKRAARSSSRRSGSGSNRNSANKANKRNGGGGTGGGGW